MVTLYPPGLDHAELHATTGDMPLSDQPVTFENIIVAMTTAVAYARAVDVTITSTATSGEALAIHAVTIANNLSGDLELCALVGIARVSAGIDTGTGKIRGGRLRFEALAGSTVGGIATGLHIDLRGEAGVTWSSNVFGIHIQSHMQTIGATAQMIRLEENGGVAWDHLIAAHFGAGSDCEYFFYSPSNLSGWQNSGNITTKATAGWLRLVVAGERYIQLYGP